MPKYTCSKCGSDKVQLAMWVRPNTGEVGEPVFDHVVPNVTSRWCEDCDEEHEILVPKEPKTTTEDVAERKLGA